MAFTLPITFGTQPAGTLALSLWDTQFAALGQLVVANIAELRTLPKTGLGAAYVLGTTTPGDGGGGWFYMYSPTGASGDNSVTLIIAADGAGWQAASRLLPPPGSDLSTGVPTVVSGTNITATNTIIYVSGTTPIATINKPWPEAIPGVLTIIPTGLWTTNTAGNIALATTAVVNKALTLTFDPTAGKWYPSY